MEIRCIPPCPDYDIRGMEGWLEDMARNGRFLCQGHAFQYGYAYFETGEPRETRYRLIPAPKIPQQIISPNSWPEPPDEETLALHRAFGWEYITYRGQFWVFACENPDAPEMDTDPNIQSIALGIAEKRLKEHFFWLMLYGLIVFAGRTDLFCITLAEYGLVSYWPIPVFLILVCIAWLPGILHLIRFRRKLKQGTFPEPTVLLSPARAQAQYIARFLPFLWLIASIFLNSTYEPKTGDSLTPELAAELPYVTASDLFPEAEITYISNSNYIFQWDTDSAPECVNLAEHFRLTLPDGTTATGIWELRRYETAFDWIAGGCARETRFQYWLRGGTRNLDVSLPGADWFRAFHADNPDRYRYAHDVILLQEGTLFWEASLILFDDFPVTYSPEELGQFLLDSAF